MDATVASRVEPIRRPYRPSWIDRLTRWVADLPGPDWIYYAAVGIVSAVGLTLAGWMANSYPSGTFRLPQLAIAFVIAVFPWLARRFNLGAVAAFDGLGDVLEIGPKEAATTAYRLANLPATPTFLAGAFVTAVTAARAIFVPSTLTSIGISLEPISLVVAVPVLVVFSFVGTAFPLKIAYQAWLVHRITTRDIRIDLNELPPLYAFSTLTARMAISLVVTGVVIFLSDPRFALDPIGLVSFIAGLLIAATVFFWPLSGVHARLVTEKTRQKQRVAQRIDQVTRRLHQAIEDHELAAMDPLNKAIAALEIEARLLDRVPTWPWEPETLRWVVGALMFPVVLFLAQLAIQRLVN